MWIDFRPGCSLQVVVKGFAATRGLGLYILQAGRTVARYDYMDQQPFHFSGLPVGETEVMLSFDNFARETTAIARSEPVQLSAGTSSVVSLTMPTLPGPSQQGEVKGVLSVEAPELWSDLKDFQKLAVILDQDPPTPEFLALPQPTKWLTVTHMNRLVDTAGAAVWEWKLSGVPAGTYTIRPYPIGSEKQITVKPGEATPVNLSIGQVARTLIDVLHGGEGCPGALLFNSTPSRAAQGGLSVEPFKELGESSFTLVTLPGEVSVFAVVPGLAPATKNFTVFPGWNSAQIDVPVALSFELVAVDSFGERVPFGKWFDLEVHAVDGRGVLISRFVDHFTEPDTGVASSSGVFFVSEPGEYEIVGLPAAVLPSVIRVVESAERERHQVEVLTPDL